VAVDEHLVAVRGAIPIRQILPWAFLGALAFAVAYYFVGAEQGAISYLSGKGMREFVDDARHFLGFACPDEDTTPFRPRHRYGR
jgi:hypothetical protein